MGCFTAPSDPGPGPAGGPWAASCGPARCVTQCPARAEVRHGRPLPQMRRWPPRGRGTDVAGPGGRTRSLGPCPRLPGLARRHRPWLKRPQSHTSETTILTQPVKVPGTRDPVPGPQTPGGRPRSLARSGAAEGRPPPQPPAQAVLDPALLPLPDGRRLVGRPEHGEAAAPAGRAGSSWGNPGSCAPRLLAPARPSQSAGALPPRAATRGRVPVPAGAPPRSGTGVIRHAARPQRDPLRSPTGRRTEARRGEAPRPRSRAADRGPAHLVQALHSSVGWAPRCSLRRWSILGWPGALQGGASRGGQDLAHAPTHTPSTTRVQTRTRPTRAHARRGAISKTSVRDAAPAAELRAVCSRLCTCTPHPRKVPGPPHGTENLLAGDPTAGAPGGWVGWLVTLV